MAVNEKFNETRFARGTLYETAQIRAWKITPTSALTASNTDVTVAVAPGTIQRLAVEFGTTGALFQAKSDGTSFVVIGDSHALDADTINVRAARVLGEAVTVVAITNLYGIA